MNDDAVIVLDPINRDRIDEAMGKGLRTFVGGNCTVSLMLLALHGLVKLDAIEWISSMTYQAASGAGAQHMRELLQQMGVIHGAADALLADSASSILEIDRAVSHALKAKDCPVEHFGLPLAGNLIPWIDSDLGTGQSKEEWKGMAEANKMLQRATPLPIDGLCVRVGAMRCHSQALTIKLKRALPLREVEGILAAANPWVKVVANTKEETLKALTPVAVSGRMEIPIGRLRTLPMGEEYLAAFTLGDQLLWGAAEPVRRMLKIVLGKL
jgi:aspartate-semialdehyde dehydrogenase